MPRTLNIVWYRQSWGSWNSMRYPIIWFHSMVPSENEDHHVKQRLLSIMTAFKQNEHRALPSSFFLLASSSFLSLAFSASSAFAETKTIKSVHLFYVYIIKWKNWGKGTFLVCFFVKESEERHKMAGNLKYIFYNS